jgi:FKBP-type peptidyl-prolyl cis-trans isomerase FkpA
MRIRSSILSLVVLALPLPSCAAEEVKLETQDQKTLYALGAASAMNLRSLELSPAEVELMLAGLRDVLMGKSPKVEPQAQMTQIQAFIRTRNERAVAKERDASKGFLENAAKLSGAVVKDSGLIYLEKQKGSGATPSATSTVKVHYRGTLHDGTEFDSSYSRNEPATFPLNGVIPCWTEALQLMSAGGKAEIYCPSAIAYGENGQGALIKPGAALRFEVELLEIQ